MHRNVFPSVRSYAVKKQIRDFAFIWSLLSRKKWRRGKEKKDNFFFTNRLKNFSLWGWERERMCVWQCVCVWQRERDNRRKTKKVCANQWNWFLKYFPNYMSASAFSFLFQSKFNKINLVLKKIEFVLNSLMMCYLNLDYNNVHVECTPLNRITFCQLIDNKNRMIVLTVFLCIVKV